MKNEQYYNRRIARVSDLILQALGLGKENLAYRLYAYRVQLQGLRMESLRRPSMAY